MYRTIQFQIAHEILRIMREENGKPWMDNPGNVNAIFRYIYADEELPDFMKHMGNQIKDLYQNRVTPEYIANLNEVVEDDIQSPYDDMTTTWDGSKQVF